MRHAVGQNVVQKDDRLGSRTWHMARKKRGGQWNCFAGEGGERGYLLAILRLHQFCRVPLAARTSAVSLYISVCGIGFAGQLGANDNAAEAQTWRIARKEKASLPASLCWGGTYCGHSHQDHCPVQGYIANVQALCVRPATAIP